MAKKRRMEKPPMPKVRNALAVEVRGDPRWKKRVVEDKKRKAAKYAARRPVDVKKYQPDVCFCVGA